ncbi:MAG: hypothetical protein HOW73_00770 [Polyangiaceae bacterium]|nr:hypothetical protein [Polyangiaceae bacterium]
MNRKAPFFMPMEADLAKAKELFKALLKENGAAPDTPPVRALLYAHDGDEYLAEVGHHLVITPPGDVVQAIIRGSGLRPWLVLTLRRGIFGGGPSAILVGESDTRRVFHFEADPSSGE